MSSTLARLVQYITIVPTAHYRLHDTRFQLRLYALFHGRSLSRVGHALCTPLVVFCMLAALAYARLGSFSSSPLLTPNLALVLAALVAAYSFAYGALVGAIVTPLMAGAWVGANALVARLGPASLPWFLGAMWAFASLQAWSHALEPVPPPLTGSRDFVDVKSWWRSASLGRRLCVGVLGATVFVFLELIASPKILPCQVLGYLFAFGYKRDLRDDTEHGAREMLHDWRYGGLTAQSDR